MQESAQRPNAATWQHRAMRPEDVRECSRVVAEHPVIGPRYGSAIKDLCAVWTELLNHQAKVAALIEQVNGSHAKICFVGVTIFVRDEFIQELKTPPLQWVGPELIRRISSGNSPILTDRELREANSTSGMNLLVWEGCIRHELEMDSEIHRQIVNLFLHEHRGYRWKEVIASQMESVQRFEWTLQTGGLLWNPIQRRYVVVPDRKPEEIIREPHLIGLTQEIERIRPGTWVGALFDYHSPRIGLSRSEQRLLQAALSGATDQELSSTLHLALPTVKNNWRSIYGRAEAHVPELFPESSLANGESSERGKEKRRRLLTYLRDHPEELRPFSPRHLP